MRKLIILSLLVGMTSSCSLLDIDPVSTITSESFWKNPSDAQAYLTGIYNKARALSNTSYYGEDRGDAFKAGEIGPTSVAWSQSLLENNSPSYRNAYNIIHHTNLLFYYIEKLQFANQSEKNRIKAETYVLRAHTYFFLMRVWGDVPVLLDPVLSDNIELKGRSKKEDVMNLVLEDIDKALSLFSSTGFADKNMISRPAALALKADALLWKAKVLNGSDEDLNNAILVINEIEGCGVELLPDYASVFANNNKKNKEIIFSFYFERYETGNLSIATNTTSRTDNVSFADNIDEAATSPNQSRHVYAPSDKLRSIYLKNEGDSRYKSAIIDLTSNGNLILTQTNKFRGKVYTDDRYFDDDLIVYRWGDMVLLRAEAYAALNKLSDAVADLNKIRSRAGLSDYEGSMERKAVEKELCDERLRELFLEHKRWFDLVRFHAGGSINIYQEVPNLNEKPNLPLYWPINYNDMISNPNLTQTEGYESDVR